MENFKLYAWVVMGVQRIAILKAMSKPQTPIQICKKSKQYNEKLNINSTCDVLRLFKRQGLAVCLNEWDKRGRLYELTGKGEEVRDALMKEVN